MSEIYLIGDTHFGHPLVARLRGFASVEEHDEAVIGRWNSVVRVQGKVYHLGGVAMRKASLALCGRLNGKKRLVRGNHDIYPTKEYLQYFKEIYGLRVLDGILLSHIPIHPSSLERWGLNAHGHLHDKQYQDERYVCLSWERIGGVPLALHRVKERDIPLLPVGGA